MFYKLNTIKTAIIYKQFLSQLTLNTRLQKYHGLTEYQRETVLVLCFD